MITATDPNAVDYMELIGQNEHNNAQIQSIQHETSDEDVYDHDSNSELIAEPRQLVFSRYQSGHTYKQSVRIINRSQGSVRIQITPLSLDSKFRLIQHKKGSFAPGTHELFEVEFRPEKWEESADLIHVRSDHGHHLTIPVIAEPGKDVLEFPANIELCLNKQSNDSGSMESASVTVVERLKSFAPIPIDWTIEAVENSRADEFSIEPSQGTLQANGEQEVRITFKPRNQQLKDANNRQKSSSMILSISSPTVPDCDEIYCRLTGTWDGLSTTSGKTNAKRRLVQSNSSVIETKSTKSPTKQQPRIPNASTLQQHLPPIDTKKAKLLKFLNEIDHNAKFEKKKLTQRFVCIGEDIKEQPSIPQQQQPSQLKQQKPQANAKAKQQAKVENENEVYENLQNVPISSVRKEIYFPPQQWDQRILSYQPSFNYEERDQSKAARGKLLNAIRTVLWLIRAKRRALSLNSKEAMDSKADTEKQKIIKEMTRVALTLPPGPFKAFAFPLVKPDLEFNTLGALSAAPIPVVGDGSAGRPQTTAISATEKKLMEQDPVFYDIHATTEEPSSFLLPLQQYSTHKLRGCLPVQVPLIGDCPNVNPLFSFRKITLPKVNVEQQQQALAGSLANLVSMGNLAGQNAKGHFLKHGAKGGRLSRLRAAATQVMANQTATTEEELNKVEMSENLDIENTLTSITSISEQVIARIQSNTSTSANASMQMDKIDESLVIFSPKNFETKDQLFTPHPQLLEGSEPFFFFVNTFSNAEDARPVDAGISFDPLVLDQALDRYAFSLDNALSTLLSESNASSTVNSVPSMQSNLGTAMSGSVAQSQFAVDRSQLRTPPVGGPMVSAAISQQNKTMAVNFNYHWTDIDQLSAADQATITAAQLQAAQLAASQSHSRSGRQRQNSTVAPPAVNADSSENNAGRTDGIIRDWLADKPAAKPTISKQSSGNSVINTTVAPSVNTTKDDELGLFRTIADVFSNPIFA